MLIESFEYDPNFRMDEESEKKLFKEMKKKAKLKKDDDDDEEGSDKEDKKEKKKDKEKDKDKKKDKKDKGKDEILADGEMDRNIKDVRPNNVDTHHNVPTDLSPSPQGAEVAIIADSKQSPDV
jgi:ABC-type Zn2+ transport system substrate-binding protein/surface adhesin